LVRDRVKPEREANRREVLRRFCWRFGWPRRVLRAALTGLPRFIATTETAKHRAFTFLDRSVAADHGVVCIASDDAFVLGVLSSSIYVAWALAAGAWLGVGNHPRYTKTVYFDPFPFPVPDAPIRARIAAIAERLDAPRATGLRADSRVTVTGMYNVAEKLCTGSALSTAERAIHEAAGCRTLLDIHDELDAAVASACGWSWPEPPALILERLVMLHDARVTEERSGRCIGCAQSTSARGSAKSRMRRRPLASKRAQKNLRVRSYCRGPGCGRTDHGASSARVRRDQLLLTALSRNSKGPRGNRRSTPRDPRDAGGSGDNERRSVHCYGQDSLAGR
jgi:hypothetical protein